MRPEPLRDNAFAAEFAGVLVDDLAVAIVMFIERNTEAWIAYKSPQFLFAILNRRTAQIMPLEFNQIEGDK